jgi:ribonuclease-3
VVGGAGSQTPILRLQSAAINESQLRKRTLAFVSRSADEFRVSILNGENQSISGPSFDERLSQLEDEIGYYFRDRALLRRALTHRSFANEQPDPRPPHNEALEFLGDAVLEFLISAWLLELYPTLNEGTLSKMRAYTVSAANLQKQAARLNLGSYLLLNRGEEKTGGRNKTALQVDAYEAVIAAIYLDRGIEAARDFIRRDFIVSLAEIDPQNLTATDYKTALQERLQSYGLPTPQYAIVESLGPDHRRVFQVELRVNGRCIATGEGTTIKSAHQVAARAAIDDFDLTLAKVRDIAVEASPPAVSQSEIIELKPFSIPEPESNAA